MKASNFFICCLLSVAMIPSAFSATSDSIRIEELNAEISTLKNTISELSKSQSANQKRTNDAVVTLRAADQKMTYRIDSLSKNVEIIDGNLIQTAEKLGVEIKSTNESLGEKADAKVMKQRTILGVVFFILLTIISVLIYVLLRLKITRGTADIYALQKKAEKLNEEIVGNFSSEMSEMQKISASLSALSTKSNNSSSDPDHSLIKTLADRITFMEMTLSKMDASIRGYKQLSKSIVQMKDNLKANGYELVDMLGKPYNDGMKVTATFIEDENLEKGQQIITGIIKPQINFQGVMIQAAQITVSQNN